MVAKIRGEAVAAPQTSRDTMFQINNTLEATDTDTDGPHTHVHLPPVSSLSTASDVTQPVARAPGTSYNNPFSVEGLQELHDKMDQLTRRVNYHGVELEAALSVRVHCSNIPRNPHSPSMHTCSFAPPPISPSISPSISVSTFGQGEENKQTFTKYSHPPEIHACTHTDARTQGQA